MFHHVHAGVAPRQQQAARERLFGEIATVRRVQDMPPEAVWVECLKRGIDVEGCSTAALRDALIARLRPSVQGAATTPPGARP